MEYLYGFPTLDRIRPAGVMPVCTTGNYTPFSLIQFDGSYRGADIDMAQDLAALLAVRLQFVPTVWVGLLDDFLADKFDIAMGGVTVTAARAEQAFFSVPRSSTASGRCAGARTAAGLPRLRRSTSREFGSSPTRVPPTKPSPAPISRAPT